MLSRWYQYRAQLQARRQARRQMAVNRSVPNNSWVGRVVGFPLAILQAIGRTFQTLMDLMGSARRSWRDLVLGLPAILTLLVFIAATALGNVSQSKNARQYWVRGTAMLGKGEPQVAQIYLQKALQGEGVNKRDIVFSLARSYEATEDFVRADALMSSLAPANEPGYPAAHRYLAVRTGQKVEREKQMSLESLTVWQYHLTHSDEPGSSPLNRAWGTYYLVGGDLSKAAEHFRVAAEDDPALLLQVAELEARMNDVDAVRTTLATARQRLEQKFLSDPGNSQNRLLFATSLFYLGELPAAETLLKQGLLNEDSESFRKLLAAVFVRMYDVELESETGATGAFQFIKLALDYEPNYQPALSRIVQFSRSAPERLEASREIMRKLISSGQASAMAHFALGTLEHMDGNTQLAQLNMRQALGLDPKLAVVANNLAYLMAQEENPDLQAALDLVNEAVEAEPLNAGFLDTRADIYFRLGKMDKAAVDYQKALESNKSPEIQQRLAEIYTRLGDDAMAAQYRAAAEGK